MSESNQVHRNSVIIIPSLNPDKNLLSYIDSLIKSGFEKIILVDDGSADQYKYIFEAARSRQECEVLVHMVNMGKGRALKDAMNVYCQKYAGCFLGVITVDSDGQHLREDVIKLDEALRRCPEALALGVRDFDHPFVPFKSRFGNKLTRHVLRIFIGRANAVINAADTGTEAAGMTGISDTQTGLRAIPNACVYRYLTLAGERFEYETNMLIDALRMRTPIQEVKIQTVYLNENKETHFRPVADSAAIYGMIFFTFFKYTFSSVSSFLIDYSVYGIVIFLLGGMQMAPKIWLAAFAARSLSSVYNYVMNMAVVFQNTREKKKTLAKYYTLCILQACSSALLIWMLCSQCMISEMAAKLAVDTILFLVSYQIQKNWVFAKE